ncbi:MAG: long-chain fatty acid--CoA ligase, partial [Pseudobdellovibrionaceae bacterium]|nr:long-chain fatty acid--CoA ligase [Pseudobdellovibrionaceae bacterium]
LMGGTPIARHFRATDSQMIEDILRFRVNALVITPRSGSNKGGSLEDLLSEDPDFLRKAGIKALIVSSTPLTEELLEEVRMQGVEFIVNFYGSTEALPDAASCEHAPTHFHITQGPNYVEVVDADGRHVGSGERGLVAVSRIGSMSESGIRPAEGSQIFRLLVGDEATYDASPCPCGRLSARIYDVKRVQNIEEKLSGGCERWE